MATAPLENRKTRTAIFALLGALFMLGLGYAAVPLYDLFCRVTGFGGTTQRASESDAAISAQFARSSSRGDDFGAFRCQHGARCAVDLRAGPIDRYRPDRPARHGVLHRAQQWRPAGDRHATFNVEPEQAGRYFNKIQCFCFTEQTLDAGAGSADAGAVLRRSRDPRRSQHGRTSNRSRSATLSTRRSRPRRKTASCDRETAGPRAPPL